MKIITKTILTIVAILFANACATTTSTTKSLVGEYEANEDGTTYKYVLLNNGICETYKRGKKFRVYNWTIEKGELHLTEVMRNGDIRVLRINADKSITLIADIEDGKRTDWPENNQPTMKKIK